MNRGIRKGDKQGHGPVQLTGAQNSVAVGGEPAPPVTGGTEGAPPKAAKCLFVCIPLLMSTYLIVHRASPEKINRVSHFSYSCPEFPWTSVYNAIPSQ